MFHVKICPFRIINLTSFYNAYSTLAPDRPDLNMRRVRSHDAEAQYGGSKLCAILYANHLARKLREDNVVCSSVHPGKVCLD